MEKLNVPAAQQLRFAKKTTPVKPVQSKSKPLPPLLRDHNRRLNKLPWTPTFSAAFRILILMRFFAGMYSIISDCDEVFNYWEPLHYLTRGQGFQTWEHSPDYAIRSYFYLALHVLPDRLGTRVISWDKRPVFFLLRLIFATVSSLCETTLYRSVVVNISPRVGRYLFFGLLFSAGLYAASTAFLPSTFAMWGVMLSTAASLYPVDRGLARISLATMGIALAAIVGWPFSALLGVPLVLEQLFFRGTEKVAQGKSALWAAKRARNMLFAGLVGASLLIPVVLVDSSAYGKLTIVPLNIINYNIFAGADAGPNLYGTEPASYYLNNLLLNFNILVPLALLSLPALLLSSIIDPKRFGDMRDRIAGQTAPPMTLALKLVGMHLWIGILLLQEHKEERFLFPAYGLIVLNAAVTIFLLRGMGEAMFIKITKSPYRVTQTPMFTYFTRAIMITTTLLSLSRIAAVRYYYHAPLNVYAHFQALELPRLALRTFPTLYAAIDPSLPDMDFLKAIEKSGFAVDLAPLQQVNDGQGVRLCVGKEWHRFPGHYLVPDQVEVRWIKSEFDGILPKVWGEVGARGSIGGGTGLLGRDTNVIPTTMNQQNREERDRYVNVSTCDYLIDVDFKHRDYPPAQATLLEPRYAIDTTTWDRVFCYHFLDAENSARFTRSFLLPLSAWHKYNSYGDYCLLQNKARSN